MMITSRLSLPPLWYVALLCIVGTRRSSIVLQENGIKSMMDFMCVTAEDLDLSESALYASAAISLHHSVLQASLMVASVASSAGRFSLLTTSWLKLCMVLPQLVHLPLMGIPSVP